MKKQIFGIGIMTLFMIGLVMAGVTFKDVVEVYPGEIMTESLKLQNLGDGAPDLVFEGSIREGEEIVVMDKTKVKVPSGEIKDFSLKIKAPSGAKIGDTFDVKMVFRALPDDESSGDVTGLQFIKSVGISFEVKVVEKPKEIEEGISTTWIILGIIAILILIAIIWFVVKNKKEAVPVEK